MHGTSKIAIAFLFKAILVLGSADASSQATTTVTPNLIEFPVILAGIRFDTSYVIAVSGLTSSGGDKPYTWRAQVSSSFPFWAAFDSIPMGGSTSYYYNGSSPSHAKKVYVWYAPTLDYILGPMGVITNASQDITTPIVTENVSLWGGPLPIQLASFFALKSDGNGTRLTWTTISEINNFGFEVQRSLDGTTFAGIAGSFVRGSGTTNASHTYSYVDMSPAGTVSYRLKQTDLDGTVNYSEPVLPAMTTGVAERGPTAFGLEQNYPNPFNPTTVIRYQVSSGTNVTLRAYDLLGREVATLVNEFKTPGAYEVQFSSEGMASGMYLYRLQAGSFTEIHTMVVMK
jgi:hypothetical protein